MPQLKVPSVEFLESYIVALEEGYRAESEDLELVRDTQWIRENPQAFIAQITGPQADTLILPHGEIAERVPETLFWFIDGAEFIGEIVIRHRLTPVLEKLGGHIGYSIRSSWQGRGMATEMLRQALEHCKTMEFTKCLVTCKESNVASARVIEKNGGVLREIIPRLFGEGRQKLYWVPVV